MRSVFDVIQKKEEDYVAGAGSLPGLGNRIRELVAEATASPFPPSSTDPRILMSDWSHFQGEIDIGTHLAYGPPRFRGVVIRSGQGLSSSLDDARFIPNVQICEANNFPWMCYHVLLPNQDVPQQVAHLKGLIDQLGGPLPKWIWWDVELHNDQSKKRVSDATIEAVTRTKEEMGVEVGVYSAKWFTDGFMETQDWFSEIVWWIAQWMWPDQQAEHPWPTALPATVDISQVMIHQTTSHGDGRLVGMGSSRVDFDRWMWTEQRFKEIMGVDEPPPPPPSELEKQVKANTEMIAKLVEWAKNLSFEEDA